MTRYSVQLKDKIVVIGCGFLSFTKNIDENISKKLSKIYSQELLNHSKKPATDV